MDKTTYKNIKWLTENDWSDDVREVFKGIQPIGYEHAYYRPSNCNWSYVVMVTAFKGKFYEVVTRFGSVEGGRELELARFGEFNNEKVGKQNV